MRLRHDSHSLPPEEVVPFRDAESGASGVIVLHSTALGPAAGGCRFWRYASDQDAVVDALRLAEGMALKNALADLPFGGGKAVLRSPERPHDRAALFRAFGRVVRDLKGRYVTAEDVGTGVADMEVVAGETRHVAGLPPRDGRPGGDPSPWTALGVVQAMRVAVRHRLDADLSDVTVAVQGLGHVGFALCELLHGMGAKLIVAEPRSEVAARAADRFGAMVHFDDCHATGFLGATGRGTHEHCGVGDRIDLTTGTLGKALGGASGGYTSGRKELIELLRQRSRPYLFSNSVAPPIVGGAMKALEIAARTTELKDRVMANARYFRDEMHRNGFDILPGEHPIVPIMVGDATLAAQMADRLLELGVYVIGFSYPVVPMGKARIRVQMSAVHSREDLDFAIEQFQRAR